ncbi:hypothetical protein AX14_009559 [Amanita brunnescens Koide BX004]|nr:hypothetical protein AX14_009559 [Amanita brunnescens Koide BX004]
MIQLKILFTKKPSPALLGIYEEGPLLFLVSPFMTNGALHDWRKQHVPVRVDEIQRLLLEVAEGVQYIHSEGIVHGDLRAVGVQRDAFSLARPLSTG